MIGYLGISGVSLLEDGFRIVKEGADRVGVGLAVFLALGDVEKVPETAYAQVALIIAKGRVGEVETYVSYAYHGACSTECLRQVVATLPQGLYIDMLIGIIKGDVAVAFICLYATDMVAIGHIRELLKGGCHDVYVALMTQTVTLQGTLLALHQC